jgi:hypothetical protein
MDGAVRLRGFIAVGVVAASTLLSAQQQAAPPLGDVAREAEAAKATAKKAKKSYSNADLTADPHRQTPAATAASATASTPASGAETSPAKVAAADAGAAAGGGTAGQDAVAEQSEPAWRARAESLRVQITRLQDQMTAMPQPNAARDANPAARARFDADVARVRTGLDGLQKQWAKLEDAARYAKVKTEWLDPRPKF